jgi:hypothetical protein
MKRVCVARRLLSSTVLGCISLFFMGVSGCAPTTAVVEPPVETATPPPVGESAPSPPIGPPPGYVAPTNYWVREKIILGSAPEPAESATKKRVKKGQKSKKTVKPVS